MTPIEKIENSIKLKQKIMLVWPEDIEKLRDDIRELRRTLWVFEDLEKMREKGDEEIT